MIHPIILAGGVGTRLWPLSRAAMPKQFINLHGQKSLFQTTLERIENLPELGTTRVLGNSEHRFMIAEQLRQQGFVDSEIYLEPVGRNTAPAVTVAALAALAQDPQAVILVLPADHLIEDVAEFEQSIQSAIKLAQQGLLVTFGIVPGSPETGYGYVKKGEALAEDAFRVSKFVEKPDLETAEAYLQSGDYFWNSGMFLFPVKELLDELALHAADILNSCRAAVAGISTDLDFRRIPEQEFAACRSESIDYALMEKTDRAAMVPLAAGWSDLGSWQSLWEVSEKDDAGNAVAGQAELFDTSNSYIYAGSRTVASIGLDNIAIIETDDAVLVAEKSRLQAVKQLVERLLEKGSVLASSARLVHRPWGSYQSLAEGAGFQVKHIVVSPGGALSLQRHSRRTEHWTVIKGAGLIHCDGKDFTLSANESTYIPLGAKHRLSNPAPEAVELIEVQLGDYLGEDDIERFDDNYGRSNLD
jgi:mannose-1-phosphate guanylyltransferase/mannose-6-phosphate isomerase